MKKNRITATALVVVIMTSFFMPVYVESEDTNIEVIKLDTFDTDSLNNWDMTDGVIENGELVMKTAEALKYPLKCGLRWKSNSELSNITECIKECSIVMKLAARLTLRKTGTENGYMQLDLCNSSSGDGVNLVRLEKKDNDCYDVKVNTTGNGLSAPERLAAEGIGAGEWVDVALLVFGDTVEYFIDGKPVGGCLFTSNRPQVSGGVRLSANNGSTENELVAVCDEWSVVCSSIDSNRTVAELPDKDDMDIYLFIGDPGISEKAALEPYDIPAIENVLLYNSDNEWEKAEAGVKNNMLQGMNRYSASEKSTAYRGADPSGEFARFTAAAYPGKTIGVVSETAVNTTVAQWKKGTGTGYYEKAIARARSARENGTLKGVIWLGEEDADGISEIITDIRSDLNINDLPFVAGIEYTGADASSQRYRGAKAAQEMYRLINGSYKDEAYVYEAAGAYIEGREKPFGFEASVLVSDPARAINCYIAQYDKGVLKDVVKSDYTVNESMKRIAVSVEAAECGSTDVKGFIWEDNMIPAIDSIDIGNYTDALYKKYFSAYTLYPWQRNIIACVGEESGMNAIKQAIKVVDSSTVTEKDTMIIDNYEVSPNGKYTVKAADAGHVQHGRYADSVCSSGDTIECKYDTVSADVMRKALVKFDISKLPEMEIGAAYIDVYCTAMSAIKPKVMLTARRLSSRLWSSDTLTWNNMPDEGEEIGTAPVLSPARWCRLDVTNELKDVFGETECLRRVLSRGKFIILEKFL